MVALTGYADGIGSSGLAAELLPADFIAKLAALVPEPRVNLTRYHGVFAPNSRHRAQLTPAKRGKGNMTQVTEPANERPVAKRRASMTWAQRLWRVFNIDVANSEGRPIGTAALALKPEQHPGVRPIPQN